MLTRHFLELFGRGHALKADQLLIALLERIENKSRVGNSTGKENHDGRYAP
jgi:hypothetical protein